MPPVIKVSLRLQIYWQHSPRSHIPDNIKYYFFSRKGIFSVDIGMFFCLLFYTEWWESELQSPYGNFSLLFLLYLTPWGPVLAWDFQGVIRRQVSKRDCHGYSCNKTSKNIWERSQAMRQRVQGRVITSRQSLGWNAEGSFFYSGDCRDRWITEIEPT